MSPILKSIRSPRGFCILPIHYTADPEKDERWKQAERAKYLLQADWDREQEMDFTAMVGTRAYGRYDRHLNNAPGLILLPNLPLCLCCDFNVQPMIWNVAQIFKGIAHFVDQIKLSPASIPDMVIEFRNRYPSHDSEIWVYGDATGRARTAQTAQSDYDLFTMAMRGYPAPIVQKVPAKNPLVKDRLAAVNNRMRTTEGVVGIKVNPETCPDLIQDFVEVVMNPNGRDLYKVYDPGDPYHDRTHSSDNAGYFISWEWPTVSEVSKQLREQPRPPRKYGKILGTI